MYGRKDKEEERPVNKHYLGGQAITVEDVLVSRVRWDPVVILIGG